MVQGTSKRFPILYSVLCTYLIFTSGHLEQIRESVDYLSIVGFTVFLEVLLADSLR